MPVEDTSMLQAVAPSASHWVLQASQGQQQFSPSQRPSDLLVQRLDFSVSHHNFKDDDEIQAFAAPLQTEPEPDTSTNGPLLVSTRIEYSALPVGQLQDVFGLVSIQAAAALEQGVVERQPMDTVCVLDVSGSMNGDKIQHVQDAARFIIDQAEPHDRLSIVSFNSQASRALRLRIMNAEGKNDAIVATLRLQAQGGTSIAAGLGMALDVMEQRRQRNKVSAIMLLTDGKDASTQHRLPGLLSRAAQANCAIYAFGFGSDHDAALLSDIAEKAHTPFTYVEDTEKIREAFAGAVGGMSSIVAQNVELTLKAQTVLKAIHTAFPLQRISDVEAMVRIPDMFAQERRDILVELATSAVSNGFGQTALLEASARYTDLRRNCIVQTPVVVMEAQHVEEPQPEVEPDEEVSAQRQRVEVTRALDDASNASDSGNFEEALQLIDAAENHLKSARQKTAVSEALGQELVDARNRMKSRSTWESGGRAEIRDATQMHKMQRCTSLLQTASSPTKMSKAMYCSPTQMASIGLSKRNT